MSNFYQPTEHPDTGEIEIAAWLDDYFGRNKYGIQFPDGKIFRELDLVNFPKIFSENPESKEYPSN